VVAKESCRQIGNSPPDQHNVARNSNIGSRLAPKFGHWPAAEVIAGYRSQSEAEFSFRQMKDPRVVSFSPMHHWTDHNIRVHVFTCVLACKPPT